MSSPTAMAFAPDGRLFVAEQTGALRVIKAGALLRTPFTTLSVNSSGERGLLGVAFDPAFASNNFVYLYYTTSSSPVHNRLSRFTANGDVVLAGSELVLLDLDNLSTATNHNGGAIHFGPDGKLYIAVGENANGANAQSFANLLGKMLRINKDGTIPTDNPFFGSTTGKNRAIWALGLRNPFTFNFQPGTGRMFINDVGQSAWEEINDGVAASNYGWPATEGTTANPAYRSPLHVYGHGGTSTTGCAITGGVFYNPPTVQFPASYVGKYFFADYCTGWIRIFDPATSAASGFATGISAPVDLQVSGDGSLYYLYRGSGAVKRIDYTASLAPSITQHPASVTVTAGQPASFTCAATAAAPLSYQWQRNGVNIAGATSATYNITSTVSGDNGAQFRCVATNTSGSATSNPATLTVTANTAPVASITSPASGATYAAGDTINYAGTGTDAQDGALAASRFTWQVDFHHNTHTHPFIPATTGATFGSFVVPNTGETAANVWYRIYLTVQDSGGLTQTVFRDVSPRTSQITVATVRSGLQVTVDGQPFTAPYTFTSVVGMQRVIGTSSPQTITAAPWTFQSWSGGGAMTHTITTPASNTTYTTTFKAEVSIPKNEGLTPIGGASGAGDIAPVEPPAPPPARSTAGGLPQAPPPQSPRDGAESSGAERSLRSSASITLLRQWNASLSAEPRRFWFDVTPHAAFSRALRLWITR
ncbi:MAG: PQQ-dependent sugar dehydrogenase [Chloroflexi bacterium]|nr:PQQ-dependent sugar dehydrogenase [Chloroflexota bacterium]